MSIAWRAQTASWRRRIARGAGCIEVDVCNIIRSFSGVRSKMQSLSKVMKMGGGGPAFPHIPQLTGRYAVDLSGYLLMHVQEVEMTQMDSIPGSMLLLFICWHNPTFQDIASKHAYQVQSL